MAGDAIGGMDELCVGCRISSTCPRTIDALCEPSNVMGKKILEQARPLYRVLDAIVAQKHWDSFFLVHSSVHASALCKVIE